MMKTLKSLRLVAASVLALGVVNAYALTDTDDIVLQATVVANCIITTGDINFGNYDPIDVNAATPIDENASITTKCTIGSSPTLAISNGANNAAAGGEGVGRKLRKGVTADYMTYALFSDVAGGTAWVNGLAVTTPSGTDEVDFVFARLAAGQNKPIGVYNDTVTVTVTF